MLLLILTGACHKRVSDKPSTTTQVETSSADAADEQLMQEGPAMEGPTNTVIWGQIEEVLPISKTPGYPHCETQPCRAIVNVLAIKGVGSNYHGQYEAGQVIEVQFAYTLSPTEGLYKTLNFSLPGMVESEVFEAEIHEPEAGEYIIKYYEKKS